MIESNIQTRLKILGVTNHEPWFDEKLILEDNIENIYFWKTLPSIDHGIVDVPFINVKGTHHPNYGNKTWLQNLQYLSRFYSYYTRESILKYFATSNNLKTDICFNRYDERYFVSSEGNHRTTIAKFLGLTHIKANVTEYVFDYEFFNLINEFRTLKFIVNSESSNIYRGMTWKLKLDNLTFIINSFEMLKEFIQFYKTINISWLDLKIIQFKQSIKLDKTKDFFYINNHIDFTKALTIELKKSKNKILCSEKKH